LAEFGLDGATEKMNTGLARISREAVEDRALVFGDIAPTGEFIEPFGNVTFEEAVGVYAQQVRALVAGGVDGIVIETMMDLQEARAALIATKETCDLPTMVSMTFGTDGRTLNGTDPLSALITLQSLGADAVGCDCSTGPGDMAKIIAIMKPFATVPLLAKPNARMPKLVKGVTKFDMMPAQFGDHAPALVAAGAAIIGSCCGTAPVYIEAVKRATTGLVPKAPERKGQAALCSYRETVRIGDGLPLTVLGGKINPSGNPRLASGLREENMAIVAKLARQQVLHGADIIDVNVCAPGVTEASCMRNAVLATVKACGKPVAVDTISVEAAKRALRVYPGRTLLNSVCAKDGAMERMCSVAKQYGAMIVCMPVGIGGVPATLGDAIVCIDRVLACAERYGMNAEDCLVDCLVMTASAGPEAHLRTLELIDWCAKQRGVASVCGISNLSYGLHQRHWVESTFLCMTASRGMTAAFFDTASEYTVNTLFAVNALAKRDGRFARYLERFGRDETATSGTQKSGPRSPGEAVFDAVVAGDEEGVASAIEAALQKGETARALVDERLIPAINLVGEKFDRKEFFWPQLISCADTMRRGFAVLQPILNASQEASGGKGPKVLLATVQGDIYDIGKNIVALMLKNYNFDVVDLGKDVGAEAIVRAAKKHKAGIIGLSALMTTTMVEMKNVIDLAHREGLKQVRFMIGGAVVDQHYADEIGAHGYAGDAIGAVRFAQRFSGKGRDEG
jgi:5-methyltetrahydrofolate--homocysteine methyltransferase